MAQYVKQGRTRRLAYVMQEIVHAVEGDPCLYQHRNHLKEVVNLVAEYIEH